MTKPPICVFAGFCRTRTFGINKVSVPSDRWAGPGFNMRGGTGLGINPSQARLFEVWVAAADYDQARFLIRGGD